MADASPYIGVDSPEYMWSAQNGIPLDFAGGDSSSYTYMDFPASGSVEKFSAGAGAEGASSSADGGDDAPGDGGPTRLGQEDRSAAHDPTSTNNRSFPPGPPPVFEGHPKPAPLPPQGGPPQQTPRRHPRPSFQAPSPLPVPSFPYPSSYSNPYQPLEDREPSLTTARASCNLVGEAPACREAFGCTWANGICTESECATATVNFDSLTGEPCSAVAEGWVR